MDANVAVDFLSSPIFHFPMAVMFYIKPLRLVPFLNPLPAGLIYFDLMQGFSWGKFGAGNRPLFFPNRDEKFPHFITNFLMSAFVLHFGENSMKIAPKITKLQLITFRFVVCFDEYF